MNYRLNENKMNHTFEILNLTTLLVVKAFKKKSVALSYLSIINKPRYGHGTYHKKIS